MAVALRSTRSGDDKRTRSLPVRKNENSQYGEEMEDMNNGDEEENIDIEDEEEAETRCICGELDPPDENGLFIQCEKCQVWQHGFCVSISENVPEKYWCELCKPELHSIIIRPNGKISRYLPVQPKDVKDSISANNRRKNRKTNSGQPSKSQVEEEHDLNNKRKKERATYNSREDARYEALIQRVMEESKKDAKVDTSDEEKSNSRHSRSNRRRRHTDLEEEVEGDDHDHDDYNEDNDDDDDVRTTHRNHDETHNDDPPTGYDEHEESKKVKEDILNKTLHKKEESEIEQSSTINHTQSKKSNDSESNDSSASRPKRSSKRSRKPAVPRNQTSPQKDKDSSIDFSKPTKPRLPQQRTTMNEMRKRVAAILEFIGRTQIDLATEQKDESELTKYVEDSKSKENIEKLFQNYNGSLELMDALTRKLLIWEQKFGKLGDR